MTNVLLLKYSCVARDDVIYDHAQQNLIQPMVLFASDPLSVVTIVILEYVHVTLNINKKN